MALSPKEREKIIEEETLRFKTRQDLHAAACASHPRRGRWLFWLAAAIVAYAVWCWVACGGGAWGMHGWGGHCKHAGMGQGRGCQHSQMMEEAEDDKAELAAPPAAAAPKSK